MKIEMEIKTKIKQFRFLTVLIFSLCSITAHAAEEALCQRVKAVAEQGDILFLALDDMFAVFRRVAEINDSWVNHVGVVMKDVDGNWIVRESSFPKAKDTEICNFIHRTSGDRIALRRLKHKVFSAAEISTMNAEMDAKMGSPYDLKFNYNKEKYQFCSKFVYQVFEKIGMKVGELQTLEEIFRSATNREQKVEFWVHWFGGSIPWSQITVTPYSQYIDSGFQTVLDTSGAAGTDPGN